MRNAPLCVLLAGCNGLLGLDPPATGTAGEPAPSCATGWSHRQRLTVSNLTGRRLSDYQLFVTELDTASLIADGHLRPDGHDLRVTLGDGATPVPHVIESDLGTTGTKLWIKPAFLPAGESTLFVYHGNPTAEDRGGDEGVFVQGVVANPSFENASGWQVIEPPPYASRWAITWPHTGGYVSDGSASLLLDLEQDDVSEMPHTLSLSQAIVIPPGDPIRLRFDLNIIAASEAGWTGVLKVNLDRSVAAIWHSDRHDHANVNGLQHPETAQLSAGPAVLSFVVAVHPVTTGAYFKAEVDHLRWHRFVEPEPTVTVGNDEALCPSP